MNLSHVRCHDTIIITGIDAAGHRHEKLRGVVGCAYKPESQGGAGGIKVWPEREEDVGVECQERCAGKIWFVPDGVEELTVEPDDDSCEMWCCPCGLLVDGTIHCPSCGACPPWGCGMDHEEEDSYDIEWDDHDYGDIP